MKAVLFDFDGTIINTNDLIREGLNSFAERYRGYRLLEEEHKKMVGRPLEEQMKYINSEKWQLMTNHFKIWYNHHHNEKTCAFPGIHRLLNTLRENGTRMAIVTNNGKASLEMGIRHLGLENYFEQIITRDDIENTKPAPDGIFETLSRMNLDIKDVIFVGDTANDILAAKNAGVLSAMVGWSTIGQMEMMTLAPDYILKSPSHLLDIIIARGENAA